MILFSWIGRFVSNSNHKRSEEEEHCLIFWPFEVNSKIPTVQIDKEHHSIDSVNKERINGNFNIINNQFINYFNLLKNP